MQVVTIRLQPELVEGIEAEAEAEGFSNRTEYIRFLLRNRSAINQNTTEHGENTEESIGQNTTEHDGLHDRLDRLEDRLDELGPRSDTEAGEADGGRPERATTPEATDRREQPLAGAEGGPHEAGIDGVLDGWPPRRAERREKKREVGRTVLEHLRSDGGPFSGSDFQERLFDAEEWDLSDDTWWRNYARPALKRAERHGLVEYREGYHDYVWRGDESEGDVYDPTDEF